MKMTASVASATSSSSLSSARDDGDWVVTGINTASPPLENVDDGPSHNVHHISSRSSISIFSSPSLYSLFSSLTFPIKFRTSFPSSVFLPLWVFLAVLVSPAFGEEWSLNCQQTLYFGALNGTATLQCRVTGVNLYSTELSLASIKWIKEPEEYTALERVSAQNTPARYNSHSSYKNRASLSPSSSATRGATDVSMTISNLEPEDFGEYEIEITYARGLNFEKPKRVFPVIMEEAHGPAVVRIVGNRPIRSDSLLILKCEAEVVNPMPSIEWYHGGVKVNATSSTQRRNATVDPATNRKKMDVVSEYNLVPSALQNGDSVECRVSNPIINGVEMSVSEVLNVTFPPTTPRIQLLHKHPDWIVANEDQLVVECDLSDGAVGNPPAELALIRDGDVVLTKASADEKSRIQFKTLVDRVDDSATFKCVAKNSIGETESESRRIRVAFGPTTVNATASATTVKAGEVVSLKCSVEGTSPAPIIQWLKDGALLQSGAASNSIPEDEPQGVSTVNLEYKVTERDNNKSFACRAENRKTKITRESPVILKVLYGPKWIEEGRSTYSAREGNRKELVCPITANPPVDAWKWKDQRGDEIKVDKPDSKMELRGEKGVKLPFKQTAHIIEQVSKADFGNYTCLASNNGGQTWDSFPLSLTPAQPPDIPLNCSQTTVDVDDLTLSFACVAGFDGGAPQNQFKVQITSSDNTNNATLSNNLERVPRKDDTFRISFAGGDLTSLRLRRGREYRVRLQLCNRFGCSNFFERGLDFFVPTTTLAPTTTLKVTTKPGKGKEAVSTLNVGPNAASGLRSSPFLALFSLLLVLSCSFASRS